MNTCSGFVEQAKGFEMDAIASSVIGGTLLTGGVGNVIGSLFPAKLTPVMIGLSGIDQDKKVHDISREERQGFVKLTKSLPMTVTGLRDYKEAIITKGGVAVKEINPSTMESKFVKGLYFIGEVLDLDAVTGGFNLQIAWSTAYAAGNAV